MAEQEALKLLRDALAGLTRENLRDAERAARVLHRARWVGLSNTDLLLTSLKTLAEALAMLRP
jgi:hypothetical protein